MKPWLGSCISSQICPSLFEISGKLLCCKSPTCNPQQGCNPYAMDHKRANELEVLSRKSGPQQALRQILNSYSTQLAHSQTSILGREGEEEEWACWLIGIIRKDGGSNLASDRVGVRLTSPLSSRTPACCWTSLNLCFLICVMGSLLHGLLGAAGKIK